MKVRKKPIKVIIVILVSTFLLNYLAKNVNLNPWHSIGEPIDSLNNVVVYYNGGVSNVNERNVGPGNYNLGLKYQCVEFVKRYYFQHYNHKMPDSYGHANSFFVESIADGKINMQRNLIQYTNPSIAKPAVGDLVIYSPSFFNRYGHVAIISKVSNADIEIIQQNPGPFGDSRETYPLNNKNEKWEIDNSRILGWLRKE